MPNFGQSATPEGVADQFVQAWNTHDLSSFEKLFTADVHFIQVYDVIQVGRENVLADFKVAHEGFMKPTGLKLGKVSVKHLNSKSATVFFNVMLVNNERPELPPLGRTVQFVVVKGRGGWRISSGQLSKPNCPQ